MTASPESGYEMYDYVISLREGIMDAWGGIIGAMKASDKSKCMRHWFRKACADFLLR